MEACEGKVLDGMVGLEMGRGEVEVTGAMGGEIGR